VTALPRRTWSIGWAATGAGISPRSHRIVPARSEPAIHPGRAEDPSEQARIDGTLSTCPGQTLASCRSIDPAVNEMVRPAPLTIPPSGEGRVEGESHAPERTPPTVPAGLVGGDARARIRGQISGDRKALIDRGIDVQRARSERSPVIGNEAGSGSRTARDQKPSDALVHLVPALEHLEIRPPLDDPINPPVTPRDLRPPTAAAVPQRCHIKAQGRTSRVPSELREGLKEALLGLRG
jgi:hypothetical protein